MSTGITFKITKDNRNKCLQEMQQALNKSLEECGLVAEGYAVENIRNQLGKTRAHWYTRTGDIMNRTKHKLVESEKAVYIGSPLSYAIYVEFGTGEFAEEGGRKTAWIYKGSDGNFHRTKGMMPRPFLRPALSDHIKEYQKIFEKNGFK